MRTRNQRRLAQWGGAAILAAVVLGLFGWQMGGALDDMAGEVESMESVSAQEAIFAGGCFWCIEAAFQLMPGVLDAVSGYTWGWVPDPTYEQVAGGTTGHYEAVRILFDPSVASYEQLLDQFWRSIDPIDEGGQFYDRGSQYKTAIFYTSEEQRAQAEASKEALAASGKFDAPIATKILPARTFYIAEEYHQDYFEKYLSQYKAYSEASGRDRFLEETWSEDEPTGEGSEETGEDAP